MKKISSFLFLSFSLCLLMAENLSFAIEYLGVRVANVSFLYQPASLKVDAYSTGITSFLADKIDNHYLIEYADHFLPLIYRKKINQSKFKENSETRYLSSDMKGIYTNFLNNSKNVFRIEPETRDFFSALSYLRTIDLKKEGILYLDSNQILWKAHYENAGSEMMQTILGKKKTIKVKIRFERITHQKKIKSDILTNNLVNEKNNMIFWFSDDEIKIPLKAEYETKPFSVTWLLTEYAK